jgi:hypothetical protein
MHPELSIERVFRRELDSLSLPDEQVWVPVRRTKPSTIVAVAVAAAALVLVVAAAGFIREASGTALASTPPSVRPSVSCEPPAFSANRRCAMLLPNGIRNPAFGYNLTIPGNWREVRMPSGTDPFVIGRPSGPSLTAPFLLDRRVFTARSPEEWSAAGILAPAWDLDVQVWDRQGRTTPEWARAFPCDDPSVTLGETHCVQTEETIRGTTAAVTTVASFRWHITSYYIESGDRMVILRYMYSEMSQPPGGVLPGAMDETLKGIVRSVGLV